MNRTEPHRRRLFLKALLAAAAPVPGKAFSGVEWMEQEIFDAIHSLVLLKEEKDVRFFLENRIQQVDKLKRSEFNPSRYSVLFKHLFQPLVRFDYAVSENGKLTNGSLKFQDIKFGEVRKVFNGIKF